MAATLGNYPGRFRKIPGARSHTGAGCAAASPRGKTYGGSQGFVCPGALSGSVLLARFGGRPCLKREPDELGQRPGAKLLHDSGAMVFHRALTDPQRMSHLLVRRARDDPD